MTLVLMQTRPRWTPDDISFLCEEYMYSTAQEVADRLGVSLDRVKNKAKNLSLQKEHRKYPVDALFFAKPGTQNAYWAGFIAADGCVRDSGRLQVKLKRSDSDHLLHFASAVGFEGNLLYPVERGFEQVLLQVSTGLRWKADLARNFNITPRKSLTLKPPPLYSSELQKAYIIGYFDGDGSFWTDKHGVFYMGFIGTQEFLGWIRDLFEEWYGFGGKPVVCKKLPSKAFRYQLCGHKARLAAKNLSVAPIPTRLTRKWEIYENFEQNYRISSRNSEI